MCHPEQTPAVLLVEDEPAHAELVRRAFQDRSPQTLLLVATDLAEARALLAGGVSPALIIADWRLPDGHGVELLTSAEPPLQCPVVIMTSFGNERIAVEAIKAGALDYVVKSEATLADMPHTAERAQRQWRELSDRARMAEALRASEERLRMVVSNAPVVLFATDPAGVITLLEGHGLPQLRLSPGELVGRSIFDAWRDVPSVRERMLRALEGEAAGAVLEIGGLVFEASFSPVRSAGGSLAGVIGVAIDVTERVRAEQRLREAGRELAEAYEATLEGWSRALEMREHETAGHSQRVVELTLRLAEATGIGSAERVHVRRGALLHDIGKMAIPDRILLKPDPLDADEWVIMRQHPLYAHEMLRSIPYLRPALDIPYCHHERWDGSGYPRGLVGEEIPLAARIFAVVDVWDALTSNRPYRPAWPDRDARAFLRTEAGRQLDAKIVDLFLAIIRPERRSHALVGPRPEVGGGLSPDDERR
jgi:PAS domain S-box-containing protein/putative nucleotidyltransferase with HDIG domain